MAEKDYIERNALMEQLDRKKPTITTQRYAEGFNDAIMRFRSMVHSAPTADVVEVKHGGWRKTCVPDVFQCTVCKRPTKMDELCDSEILRAYCPNCGAKMDGEREDKG